MYVAYRFVQCVSAVALFPISRKILFLKSSLLTLIRVCNFATLPASISIKTDEFVRQAIFPLYLWLLKSFSQIKFDSTRLFLPDEELIA